MSTLKSVTAVSLLSVYAHGIVFIITGLVPAVRCIQTNYSNPNWWAGVYSYRIQRKANSVSERWWQLSQRNGEAEVVSSAKYSDSAATVDPLPAVPRRAALSRLAL